MKIVPAGKFESALARLTDEVINPRRNSIGHLYYLDLNRRVDRAFVDGVGTFIALAEETVVPAELDWVDPSKSTPEHRKIAIGVHKSSGFDRNSPDDMARFDEVRALGKQICKSDILSEQSLEYITALDLTSYPKEVIEYWRKNNPKEEILGAYLNRLLDQIFTATDVTSSYLLIAEPDIQIIGEIGSAIVEGKLTTKLPFPDLRNRLLDPNAFAHGVLNFSPKDVLAVEHVPANEEVQRYAKRIQGLLHQAAAPDDPGITDAMIDAYYRTEAGRKAKTIFEISTWVVKPLHYVPVVGEVLSVAEDIKDVAQKAAEIKLKQQEWFLIGVRMQELAIKEYLSRLSNNRHPALRQYRDG